MADLRLPAPDTEEVTFTFNGMPLTGIRGEPIAVALWANGVKRIGYNAKRNGGRGLYCGIGHCYECRVVVDGVPDVRSCITPLAAGMVIADGRVAPGGTVDSERGEGPSR